MIIIFLASKGVSKIQIYLLIILIIINFMSANKTTVKDKYTDEDTVAKIRITSSLINYNIPSSGISYEIIKYDDMSFSKNLEKYKFKPTINKFITMYKIEKNDTSTTNLKSITPDIYLARPGFYKISQTDDGFYQKYPETKIFIEKSGKVHILDANQHKSSENNLKFMDLNAKEYDSNGNISLEYNYEKTTYIDLFIYPKTSFVLNLKTYDTHKSIEDEYLIYYWNKIDKLWTNFDKIKPHLFENNKDIIYKKDNLVLNKNQKIRVEQKLKNTSGDNKNKFCFEFEIGNKYEILSVKMDEVTNVYYGDKYRKKFGTIDDTIMYEKIIKDDILYYNFFILNDNYL